MSWLKRLKQRAICRVADSLAHAREERRVAGMQAALDPKAVILSDGTVENLAGCKESIVVGANSHIRGRLLTYANGGSIKIGSWCYVGVRTEIWSMASIEIGDRVLISHGVNIIDNSGHSMNAVERHAHFRQITGSGHPRSWSGLPGVTAAPIVIEDDVWISCGVTILQGVRIGARSVIAASAIVTKDVPPDMLYRNDFRIVTSPMTA